MSADGRIRIDQIVHGYERGHRELARSFDINDEDRSTMLVMSDLLVDQALDGRNSYLSCYPLRSAARHVLARTWSAGPSLRPGSVWTHSLLIDYQALAQLSDLAALASYLEFPVGQLPKYGKPIYVELDAVSPSKPFGEHAARTAIAGVYSDSLPQIVRIPISRDEENEALALALWRQAWPGLRRDFAFLTGIAERSVPLDAGCVLRFTAEPMQAPKWDAGLNTLFEDLVKVGATPLRQFLSRYAVESPAPRGVASKLAQIWVDGVAGRTERRIAALAELSRSCAFPRLRRDSVLADLKSVRNGATLVDLVSEFRSEQVGALPKSIASRVPEMTEDQLGRLLSIGLRSPKGALARAISDIIIAGLDGERLASIADSHDRPALLSVRPELASLPAYWPASDTERSTLIDLLPPGYSFSIDDALRILGPTVGQHAAEALVRRNAIEEPITLLRLMLHENLDIRQAASGLIGRHDHIAVQLLGKLEKGDERLLEALAATRIVSQAGLQDPIPWIQAGKQVGREYPYKKIGSAYSIILLTAALKVGDQFSLGLSKFIFEPILSDLRRYRLTRQQESWLDRELPSPRHAYSLRSRLTASAVITWPPHSGQAGALTLCFEPENARDLVNDAEALFGRASLSWAVEDPALPPAAHKAIKQKLDMRRVPFGFFEY